MDDGEWNGWVDCAGCLVGEIQIRQAFLLVGLFVYQNSKNLCALANFKYSNFT